MPIAWIDRMAVDVRGEGDAVVFIHGLGGSMNAWTTLLPALGRWRCVRPELPGAGRSRKAYALGEGSMADLILIQRTAAEQGRDALRARLDAAEDGALLELDLHRLWDWDEL